MVEMVNATKTDEEGTFRFRDIRVAIETIRHYLVITHPQWATMVRRCGLDQASDLQFFGLVKLTSRPTPLSVDEGETVELNFYVDPQPEPAGP